MTMHIRTKLSLASFVLALAALPGVAQAARMFCCEDEKGARNCGDALPEACRNRAYNEFNERGVKVRSVEAPLTEAQQAIRDAEIKKKKEEDRLALEQKRRDQALMSTYATDKDLDVARDRQVAEAERAVKQAQEKLDAANKAKTKIAKDQEFYKGKALPAELKDSVKRNEAEIAAQQKAVESKLKEIEDIKARFETDKKRLRELRGGKEEPKEAKKDEAKKPEPKKDEKKG
ncbi:MAG TPA: hypothetical protein VI279_16905 [Rhodocyclaceae bacterium]